MLSSGRLPRADDSDAVPALAMRHEYNLLSAGTADCDLSILPTGVIRVGKGQGQWVEKDGCRILEGDSMLSQVALRLFRIPLVNHRLSLPHPRRETKQPRSGRGDLFCP